MTETAAPDPTSRSQTPKSEAPKNDTPRLYRRIAEQIGRQILSGEYPPGSRLPPERDFAQQLGVSRQSLREALIALEVNGLVSVAVGSGVYVCDTAGREVSPLTAEGEFGPFELMQARRLIEPEAAALAARGATAADLAAIEDAISRMCEEEQTHQPHENADRLFHLRVATASQNSALAWVVRGLWDQGRGRLWWKAKEKVRPVDVRRRWIVHHWSILYAISAHDPDAAWRAMDLHLGTVQKELEAACEVQTDAPPAPARPLPPRRPA